jgi:hypothetical protein
MQKTKQPLDILKQGVTAWNTWKAEEGRTEITWVERPEEPYFSRVSPARLIGADLSGANLQGVDFSDANLMRANLMTADLRGANLGRLIE